MTQSLVWQMGGGSLAVRMLRVFWQALPFLRMSVMRAGPRGLIDLAVTGASVLWMLRGSLQRSQGLVSREAEGGGRGALMRGEVGKERERGRGEEGEEAPELRLAMDLKWGSVEYFEG